MNFFQGDQIFLGVMEKTLGGAPSPTYGKNIGFPWGGYPPVHTYACGEAHCVEFWFMGAEKWWVAWKVLCYEKSCDEMSSDEKSYVMKSPVMKSPIVMKVSIMKCPSYEKSCDEMS